MIDRRHLLQGLALGVGAASQPWLSANIARAAAAQSAPLRRVVFFLQNQGFDPATCIPQGLDHDAPLAGIELPEPMQPLEPYKHRMHIINGLHGKHTSPSHSAYFGALGGYRGGIGIPPFAETIDHRLSQLLPETILPHLCVGMDALENMKSRPTLATLSAAGPGKPLFMYSNPNDLYQMLFGSIATGDVKQKFEARSKVFNLIESLAAESGRALPAADAHRYASYVSGFRDANGLRDKLSSIPDQLAAHAPVYDEKFTAPRFETDWHDAILDVSLAALSAGLTSVLTIGSGRGEIFGSWKGLGIVEAGHNLGHMDQPGNPIWIKIRQYNCRMLVKLMQTLESIPEGQGSMMDHTLIVYTSNNADKQHTNGATWPFVLLGNCGGRLKTGQFTQLDGQRPINALYTTLLHLVGDAADRFNMEKNVAALHDSAIGPIEQLLA